MKVLSNQHATGKLSKTIDVHSHAILNIGEQAAMAPRLLETAAPEFAGSKDRSGNIFVDGDKALLVEGFAVRGEIQGVDPQACVVAIGKSNANAITAHNPARASC